MFKLSSLFKRKPTFEDFMAAHLEYMAVLDRSNRRLFVLRTALESIPSIADISLDEPNARLTGDARSANQPDGEETHDEPRK